MGISGSTFPYLVDTIESSNSELKLLEAISSIKNSYSLHNIFYRAPNLKFDNGRAVILSTQNEWFRRYLIENTGKSSEVEGFIRDSSKPILWGDLKTGFAYNLPHFLDEQDKREAGLQAISLPLRNSSFRFGMLTFTSSRSDMEWAEELAQKLPDLMLLAQYLHDKVVRTFESRRSEKLPEREKAILKLIASGHEIKEIAAQLSRSQTTVRNELRLSMIRLNAANPYHAATKALLQGQISLTLT